MPAVKGKRKAEPKESKKAQKKKTTDEKENTNTFKGLGRYAPFS